MRKCVTRVIVVVCVALSAMVAVGHAQPEGKVWPVLPAALDAFYPPKSPAPVYWIAMLELSQSMSGIVSDAMEGDFENARGDFARFQEQYEKLAGMVPEWKAKYPPEPVKELGAAVQSGDVGAIMGAMEQVDRACHSCHLATMPAAHWKYHWDDFSAIMVTDPLSNQEVPFRVFKQMLASSFNAIGGDVAQGQPDRAAGQLQAFEARFAALKGTCDACHDSERKYYVDESIAGMIGQLKGAVTADHVDEQAMGAALMGIGQESCAKCHRVHVPAAYAGGEQR